MDDDPWFWVLQPGLPHYRRFPCCFVLLAPRSPTWSSCCWCPPPRPCPISPRPSTDVTTASNSCHSGNLPSLLCLFTLPPGTFFGGQELTWPMYWEKPQPVMYRSWWLNSSTEALLACFLEAFLNCSQEDCNSSVYSCNLLINIPFSELSPPSPSLFYSSPWATRDYSPNKQTNQKPCLRVSSWKIQNQETTQSLEWAAW